MRVLLLNPPVPLQACTNRDLMGGMGINDGFGDSLPARFLACAKHEGIHLPVLTLAYAAAILRRAGHDVIVLDQARQDTHAPATLAEAVATEPDWVVSATSFAYFGAELAYLARLHRETGCQRLLFGETATHFASEVVQRGLCEAIARGDPEVAVQHLALGRLVPGATGVALRVVGPAGTEMRDARPVFLDDLGALPWPDWSGFDIPRYGYHPLLKRRPFLTMLGSRGCPYVCDFCPYPVAQGAPLRARPVADVVAEMVALVRSHGVRSILFRDPTFSMDMDRAKAIARAVAAERLDLQWGIETRLDRLDDELIDLLGAAGCASMTFGIDPIEPGTRKASHRKGYRPDVAARLIARMRARGIRSAGLFVVGLPEQSEDEMMRTFEWIDGLELSFINYEQATVFPGTPLYAKAVAKGWARRVTLDDLLNGEPKLRFNGHVDGARMRRLQDHALRRFYARPGRAFAEVVQHDLRANVAFYSRTAWRFAREQVQRLAA